MPDVLNQRPAPCKDGAQCKQTDRVIKAPLHMQTLALFAHLGVCLGAHLPGRGQIIPKQTQDEELTSCAARMQGTARQFHLPTWVYPWALSYQGGDR